MKEETVAGRRQRALGLVKVLLQEIVDEYMTRPLPKWPQPGWSNRPPPIDPIGKSKLMDMICRPQGISHQDAEWCLKQLLNSRLLRKGERMLIDDGARSRHEDGYVLDVELWSPRLIRVNAAQKPGKPPGRYPDQIPSGKIRCKSCGMPVLGQHAKSKRGHKQEVCRLEIARQVMSA